MPTTSIARSMAMNTSRCRSRKPAFPSRRNERKVALIMRSIEFLGYVLVVLGILELGFRY
jgi:hypothetical protein